MRAQHRVRRATRAGLDVGGTKTDAVAVDDAAEIVARVRLPTAWGPEGVVRTVVDAVTALGAAGVELGALRSVGVGVPGQVDVPSGHVRHAVNLGVADLDLAAAATRSLGVPVAVENDVKAAALGAYALRGGVDRAMAYLNLGTGIAAAVVRDGEVWRGVHGTAGEVGHISVDPAGPVCRCGQRGCIEALAGGASLAARWQTGAALPVVDLMDAAEAGDRTARALRAGLFAGVAAAVRILVLATDVEAVVLGGGLTGLGDRLVTGVAAELAAGARSSAFLRSLHVGDRVELLPAGSAAAAIGAALVGAADREHNPQEAYTHG